MRILAPALLLLIVACDAPASTSTSTVAPTIDGSAGRRTPAPDDPRPTTLGSPLGSAQARPWWAYARGYAPGLEGGELWPLFEGARAEATARALVGDLLICRVEVDFQEIKSWSLRPGRWAPADLALFYGFGPGVTATDERSLYADGPNQSNVAYLAAPAVHLAVGDPIDVLLNDRDRLFKRQYIDRIRATYGGTPAFTVAGERSTLECRAVDPNVVDAALRERLWDVDDALAAWRGAADVDESSAVPPQELREAILRAAAWVGWDDPRIARRFAAAALVEEAHVVGAGRAFTAVIASAPAPGSVVTVPDASVELRALGVACDPGSRVAIEAEFGRLLGDEPCVLELEVRSTSAEAREFYGLEGVTPGWSMTLHDDAGARLSARLLRSPGGATRLAAGVATMLRIAVGPASPVKRYFPATTTTTTTTTTPPRLLVIDELRPEGRRLRLALPPAKE